MKPIDADLSQSASIICLIRNGITRARIYRRKLLGSRAEMPASGPILPKSIFYIDARFFTEHLFYDGHLCYQLMPRQIPIMS